MKATTLLALLLLPACAAAPDQHLIRGAPQTVRRVTAYVGERELDDSFFKPVEEQAVLGVDYSSALPGYAFGYEVGFMSSGDDKDSEDVEGRTVEIYGGIQKSWGDQHVHPYFGAGLALVSAEKEVGTMTGDNDDGSLAGYGHVGVRFDISPLVSLGVDYRILVGSDLEIGNKKTDADYQQVALTIGFSF